MPIREVPTSSIDWPWPLGFPMPSQELESISNQNLFFPPLGLDMGHIWQVDLIIVKCPAKDQSRFWGTGP